MVGIQCIAVVEEENQALFCPSPADTKRFMKLQVTKYNVLLAQCLGLLPMHVTRRGRPGDEAVVISLSLETQPLSSQASLLLTH